MPPFSAFQRRRRSYLISQSSSHQFSQQESSWLLLFDVIGRRQRCPLHHNSPLLPKAKVHQFSSHAGLLFYLASQLILLDTKSLTFPPVYLPGALESTALTVAEDHCDPTDHISWFLTVPTHSFLSIFFSNFYNPILWMACHFRVNSFPLGIRFYISSHVCAFPYLLTSVPSALHFSTSIWSFLGVRPFG